MMDSNQILATLTSQDGSYTLHLGHETVASAIGCRVILEYFAEGAANVLFSVKALDCTPTSHQQHDIARRKLLRLRKGEKATNNSKSHQSVAPPPLVTTAEIDHFIKDHIINAIPEKYVVEHILVQLGQGLLDKCNALLMTLEHQNTRHSKRCGWYINTRDPQGFLVADMSPRVNREITIEFKPKWLAQSPMAAAASSRRCRTCAWHAKNKVASAKRYCPLALATGDREWVGKQIQKFGPKKAGNDVEKDMLDRALDVVATYFCNGQPGHDMLRELQELQRAWDSTGAIRQAGITTQNFRSGTKEERLVIARNALEDASNGGFQSLSWAMTLRDCMIFIRVCVEPDTGSLDLEAKIADLDLKIVDPVKLLKWATDEMTLVHDGFYAGLESTDGSEGSQSDPICLLWQPPKE